MRSRIKRAVTGAAALLIALILTAAFPAGIRAEEGNAYTINGVTVRYDDFPSTSGRCWTYAKLMYEAIWGCSFNSDFQDETNLLRDRQDDELTLTPEHLKEYVTMAPLGSTLRICNRDYLHGNDGWGHSQIIVQKDEEGFTVLEGGMAASPYCREHYYTWKEFTNPNHWPGTYGYIKYIKCPLYSDRCTVSETDLTAALRCSARLWSQPCTDEVYPGSKPVETLPKGTLLTVTAVYHHPDPDGDPIWYRVSCGDGPEGCVPASALLIMSFLCENAGPAPASALAGPASARPDRS